MPEWKSTYNILKKVDEDEVFNPNWMDSNKLITPSHKKWDYKREMKIEDVNIWEQIYVADGGIGVYAAWDPYAEFYLVLTGNNYINDPQIIDGQHYWDKQWETYYGSMAFEQVKIKMIELGIPINEQPLWVDEEDMWLYQPSDDMKIISIPAKDIVLPGLKK